MIRINLIGRAPAKASSKFFNKLEDTGFNYKAWIFVIILFVASVIGFDYYLKDVLSKIDDQINTLTRQSSDLTAKAAKYNSLKGTIDKVYAEKAALEAKLAIINNLILGREQPVKMLENFSLIIPSHVWLREFSFENREVRFSGLASEFSYVSDFHKALNESVFFEKVELQSTTNVNDPDLKNGSVEEFSMRTKLKAIQLTPVQMNDQGQNLGQTPGQPQMPMQQPQTAPQMPVSAGPMPKMTAQPPIAAPMKPNMGGGR